jgi:hypothetical protein
MKTIELTLYKFSELSNEAKENAINYYLNNIQEYQYIYDEAENSIKAFNDIFSVNSGLHSWLDYRLNSIDDNILELTGLRLRKYLINNFAYVLYKPKYIKDTNGHKIGKMFIFKHSINYKGEKRTSIYSKLNKTNEYTLTGVDYDMELLRPFYEFIDNYKENIKGYEYYTFEDLISHGYHNLKTAIENEIEYNNSEEAIEGFYEANQFEFKENGQRY